jgi:nucleoside triphosphate diphosphatase
MKVKLEQLVSIMKSLRAPDSGCPWDLKQDYQSILPYTIEEVYEVADAIERHDYSDLKDELGDLLFQVVFYSQLASEDQHFDLADVIDGINKKLVRRHPHVFSNVAYDSEQEFQLAWENQKKIEREQKSATATGSLLDDIPTVLPELKRAQKIQKRVAKQGFDWPNVEQVWDKLEEEKQEVIEAFESGDKKHTEEEIGDLLFVCVNLARHYGIDADMALRGANKKFERRFKRVETLAARPISENTLEELETFWQQAKNSNL